METAVAARAAATEARACQQTAEERTRIGGWLHREVRDLPDEAVLEPGGLVKVLQDNPSLKTWRGGDRKRLIYWLRDARNSLAHMARWRPAR